MKNLHTLAAALTAIAALTAAAHADSLANPFFPGHGDPQNIFTVTNDATDDIQLGLGIQQRGSASPAPVGTSAHYFVLPSSGLTWNFDFAIDTNPDGQGKLLLSDLTALITVTGPGGLSGTYNPLALPNDNNDNIPSLTLAQNSENLSFNNIFEAPKGTGGPLGFNPSLPGTYTFTLTVEKGTQLLASDTMDVTVVPLPSAAGMGLSLLALGAGAMILRKKGRLA